jgi:hypothetical protein
MLCQVFPCFPVVASSGLVSLHIAVSHSLSAFVARPYLLDPSLSRGPDPLFLTIFPLRRATFARWVISLRATASPFHGSQFSWIRIFLTSFLLRRATFARRDIFLQAAADFLSDPRFPRGPFLLLWRLSAARFQTLRYTVLLFLVHCSKI